MSPQTENRKQLNAQTLPQNERGSTQNPLADHRLALVVALIVVAALLASGILSRVRARTTLKAETAQVALTAVSVVSPKQAAPAQEIILPGNVQPFITSPIYARTNGYLKKWYVDIGAHVKQGQLLAVIETPEVDQQLQQARSNLLTAQANLELAAITKSRYQGLLKSQRCSPAGRRQCRRHLQRQQSDCRGRPGSRGPVRRIGLFRKDLRSVRRRDHCPKHGYRRPDQLRQQWRT